MYVYKRNTLSPPIPITSPCHAVGPDARARRRRRTRRAPPNDRAIDRSIGDDDDDGDGGDAPRGDGRRPARVRTPTRHGFAGHGLDDEKMRERQDARERRSQDGVRVVGASVRGCVRFDCDSLRSRWRRRVVRMVRMRVSRAMRVGGASAVSSATMRFVHSLARARRETLPPRVTDRSSG